LYENRTMKHVEIVLSRERERWGRTMERMNLAKVHCTRTWNITMKAPIQLVYANKMFKKEILE
jgi:hypothetical protein